MTTFEGHLDEAEREQLLSRIYVVLTQPDAAAILEQLRSELYRVSLHHLDLSVQMPEGWWFKRVLNELVHPDGGIPRAEIDARFRRSRSRSSRIRCRSTRNSTPSWWRSTSRSFRTARSTSRLNSSVTGNFASATRSPVTCRLSGSVRRGRAVTCCCSTPIFGNTTSACTPSGSCSTRRSAMNSDPMPPRRQWPRPDAPS